MITTTNQPSLARSFRLYPNPISSLPVRAAISTLGGQEDGHAVITISGPSQTLGISADCNAGSYRSSPLMPGMCKKGKR